MDAEILWNRIQARLAREPERVRYNEGKKDWMDKTLSFYDNFHWDACVSNDEGTLDEVAEKVLVAVKKRSAGFESVLVRKRSFGLLSMCGAGEGPAVAVSSQVTQRPVPTRPSATVLVTPAAAPLAPADKADRFNESPTSVACADLDALRVEPDAATMTAGQPTADAME